MSFDDELTSALRELFLTYGQLDEGTCELGTQPLGCCSVHRWAEGDLWAPFLGDGTCHYGGRICVQYTLAELAALERFDALSVN
jgi:hypothetical protein